MSEIGQSKHGCAIRLFLLRKHSATTPGERWLPISCALSSRNPGRVADELEGSVVGVIVLFVQNLAVSPEGLYL
ncbi:hypothetical protein [Paraburkholderia dipogonis]|uniref:hypothetical protein n=1 Tax=Paraburkholderia dipogonis TaxID=1211383 RepID=UPI0038B993F4